MILDDIVDLDQANLSLHDLDISQIGRALHDAMVNIVTLYMFIFICYYNLHMYTCLAYSRSFICMYLGLYIHILERFNLTCVHVRVCFVVS